MAWLAFACVAPSHAAETLTLPPAVTRAMARMSVPAEHVSIHVRDANTDKTVIDLNGDRLRSPASTIKVLTTFAALDMLGPSYTWKTRAYQVGKLTDGVLTGDLVLVGGGDPYMTSERWWNFVQSLRARGLTRIDGNIIIDNSYFAPMDGSRGDFDDKPWRSYNVLPDGLMVNFQTSHFTLMPNARQSRPQISVNPLPANLVIDNRVVAAAGKCQGAHVTFNAGPDDPSTLVIGGTLPRACGAYSINRAIMNATDYAYGTFRTLWTQSGGTIKGGLEVGPLPADATLLLSYDSLPLSEIIRLVNKFSNNLMARHLLLTLGAEKLGVPATTRNGIEAISQWLTSRDIQMPGLVLDNGSGLSREERITARGLANVLDLAWHSPFMPEFAASLPLSATDGTLRNRFRGPGMQGRLRMKTGRIDDVSGLAGFVNAASGKTYVTVILVNHPGAQHGAGEAIQSELVRWVFGQ